MQIAPIKPYDMSHKHQNTNFKSKFIPTNALRLSLIEGQRTGNRTLLKSMNKLLNDGKDTTFEINAFLRSHLGEREFYKITTKISDLGEYGRSRSGSGNVEKDIVKEVRDAIKLFAGVYHKRVVLTR